MNRRELLTGAAASALMEALPLDAEAQMSRRVLLGGANASSPAFAKNGGPTPFTVMGTSAVYDSSRGITWAVWQATDGRNAVIHAAMFNHNATPYTTGTNVNIPSKAWGEIYQVGVCVASTFRQTNHGFPSICLDGAGRLHVFYGTWFNDALQHAVSTNVGDATAWTQLANVGDTTTDCPEYVNAVMVGSTMWLFYQHSVTGNVGQFRARSSSSIDGSGVVTWNAPVTVVDLSTSNECFPGNIKVVGTDVWFTITRCPQTATNPRDNIYLGRYDTTNGNVKNVDASTTTLAASLPLTDAQLVSNYLVFAPGAGNGGVIGTFAIDGNNVPHVLYAFGANPVQYYNPFDVRIRKFSGGAWSDEITGLGTTKAAFNALSLMTEADGSLTAYWPNTNATLQALSIPNGGDIYKATQPLGGSWSAASVVQIAGQTSGKFFNSNGPFPLDAPKPVLNGLAELKMIWSESVPQTGLAGLTGGFLRLYAYGSQGYKGALRQDFVNNGTPGYLAKLNPKPSAAQASTYDSMFGLMQASGWFGYETGFNFAAANQQWALTPVVPPISVNATTMRSYTLTLNGSITFVANKGFQGDGSAAYIDIGRGTQATQNNAHIAAYLLNATSTASGAIIAAGTSGSARQQIVMSNSTTAAGRINSNAAPVLPTIATQIGYFQYERGAANLSTMYQNGASIGTETNASTGLPSGNITLLGDHTNSTGFSNQILAAFALASFRGSSGCLADYNAIHPYMQAVAGAP